MLSAVERKANASTHGPQELAGPRRPRSQPLSAAFSIRSPRGTDNIRARNYLWPQIIDCSTANYARVITGVLADEKAA